MLIEPLREVLADLVALQDLKLRLARIAADPDFLDSAAKITEYEQGSASYLRRRPKAWQRAREALQASPTRPAGECVCALREYLGVHAEIGSALGGQALDDVALELARIALDFQRPAEPPGASIDPIDQLFKSPLTPYGLLVRALRCAANVTLMDMSRSVELSPAHLSDMEFGRKPLGEETLAKVVMFFGGLGLNVPISLLHSAATAS